MARITIDYTPALRQTAGIGRYTRGLIGGLRTLGQAGSTTQGENASAAATSGHRYTLFCMGERPAEDLPGFRVVPTPLPARWLTAAWHRLHVPLPVQLLAGPCDLFHSTDFTLPPLAGGRGLVTVHDLSFLRLPECADPRLAAFLRAAVPASVARAAHVLADSESTARDLTELLGVSPNKISVVPGGVEPRFERVTSAETLAAVRARYALPQRFVLAVGTLEPRKNFSRLIGACAGLWRRRELDADLVIAGRPGWLYDEIYDRVRREGASERVHFVGFVADEDLPALYSLASLLAYPSLYEGFGLPPLEAMACGTPVVASNNSSLPEAVGDAGIMVPAEDEAALADAIGRVLANRGLAEHLIAFGYTKAATYSWPAAAEKLLAAYARALN